MSLDFSNPVVRADVLYANKVVITEPVVDRSGYEFFDDFSSLVLDADLWTGTGTILPGAACGVVRMAAGQVINSSNGGGTISNFPLVSGLSVTMRAKFTTGASADDSILMALEALPSGVSFTFGLAGCTMQIQAEPVLFSAFPLVSGQWYTFEIKIVGDQMSFTVDGNEKISSTIPSLWVSTVTTSYFKTRNIGATTLDVDFVSVSSPRV